MQSRYEAGSTNPVLCDNLDRWDGVGGGRQVQEGGGIYIYIYIYIYIPIDDSC